MMDLLNNTFIKKQLSTQEFFDMKKNNDRIHTMVPMFNDPLAELTQIFNKLISEEKNTVGYYKLQNLFSEVQMLGENIIVNLIIDVVNKKITTIKDSVYNSNINDISLPMYIQAWKSYKIFSNRLYELIKNYQKFLVDKNIKIGKLNHDILSIIHICMFYGNVVENSKNNILMIVSEDLDEIDRKNVEQLIDYVNSIRIFMIMKDFQKIDIDRLSNIIRNIMSNTGIINTICGYLNQMLKNLTSKNLVIDDTEYETVMVADAEKDMLKKIYRIVAILSTYGEKNKVLTCYTKFMQARIIDLSYNNIELEIELVRRFAGLFGKQDSQNLLDIIGDIIESKDNNENLHDATINITSNEFKNLIGIDNKVLNPIFLTKKIWKIFNVSNMELNYPPELKCYINIIENCYSDLCDNQFKINLQPTLGMATFTAQLGPKNVEITCNILQAIALSYLNDNTEISVAKFAKDTQMNEELASKVIDSLFESNLIIYQNFDEVNNPIYKINHANYTGDNRMDIRKIFVEVFEPKTTDIEQEEEEYRNKKTPKNKNPTKTKRISYTEFRENKFKEIDRENPGIEKRQRFKMMWESWQVYVKENSNKSKQFAIKTDKKSEKKYVLRRRV